MVARLEELVPPVGWASILVFTLLCAWFVWHGRRVRLRGVSAEEKSAAVIVGRIYAAFGVTMFVALVIILLATAWITRDARTTRGDHPVREAVCDIQGHQPSSRFVATVKERAWLADRNLDSSEMCPMQAFHEDDEFYAVLNCQDGTEARIEFEFGDGSKPYVDYDQSPLRVSDAYFTFPDGGRRHERVAAPPSPGPLPTENRRHP